MSSTLVTGGAGFIGSNLAERLLQLGHKVVVLDDLSTGKKENLASFKSSSNFSFIKGNILDFPKLKEIVNGFAVDFIFHQAARPSVERSVKDPLETNRVNVEGTLNILWASLHSKVKKVIAASSSSVYGNTPVLPKREDMIPAPQSPYGVSKAAKELYLKIFNDLYGLKTVALRYFNVYGRKQDPNSEYAAVIPKFIHWALEGKPLRIEGDGLQTRDFTYIEDVVEANILAMEREETQGMVFNIAYGERISIGELAYVVIDLVKSSSSFHYVDKRPGDIRDSLADVSLARTHMGYEPNYNLREGLRETIRWFKDKKSP